MRIEFDRRAVRDLDNIFSYIATDSPRNAAGVIDRILAAVLRLGEFPEMARAGRAPETRELVVPRLPYVVVYKVDPAKDIVTVLAIFHGAQTRDNL